MLYKSDAMQTMEMARALVQARIGHGTCFRKGLGSTYVGATSRPWRAQLARALMSHQGSTLLISHTNEQGNRRGRIHGRGQLVFARKRPAEAQQAWAR